ncbi:2930_t:CDS:1, partial [Funneliformis caledonium]
FELLEESYTEIFTKPKNVPEISQEYDLCRKFPQYTQPITTLAFKHFFHQHYIEKKGFTLSVYQIQMSGSENTRPTIK